MKNIPDNSVDAVVTDPPYGIKFMSKKWDYDVPKVEVWREALRVLKPGGHALVACGTRTQHRMAVNIEDAGFEIRDVITWLYGSGFPKSHDISKAIDREAGAEREVVAISTVGGGGASNPNGFKDGSGGSFQQDSDGKNGLPITSPATDAAKQWHGWGSALKPACEFWTLARKPLDGTLAENTLKWEVGGLNIDACRVGNEILKNAQKDSSAWHGNNFGAKPQKGNGVITEVQDRFPANLILDEEAGALLDEQSGTLKSGAFKQKGLSANTEQPGGWKTGNRVEKDFGPANSSGASRFFYCAKASKSERNAGLERMPVKSMIDSHCMSGLPDLQMNKEQAKMGNENHHPTVKPIKLMEYLIKLITTPNGIVLDPFMGSGSTGVAAVNLSRYFIGIEIDKNYFEIAKKRITKA
jgi:DNA modification methylase